MKYIINTDALYYGDIYKSMLLMGTNGRGEVIVQKFNLDELEELNGDYINEHYGSLQDEAYQRGLDDAWECARKLFSSMADSDIEKAFPVEWNNGGFHALINLQPQEAIAKLKAYEEKQKTEDDIKVGDEVEVLNSGSKYLIAWILGTSICGFAHDGVTCRLQPSDVRKTGRHFDIDKILEEKKE
jgi:hypothetical protein